MLQSSDGIKIVEALHELPDFRKCDRLFMDFETKNNTQHIESLRKAGSGGVDGRYPWRGDRIGGIAAAGDDSDIYYIPIHHLRGNNLDQEGCHNWLRDNIRGVNEWWNHNILFDASFAAYEANAIPEGDCTKLVDTLTLAKVHDSDRMGHGLKPLLRDWLDMDTDPEDQIEAYLKAEGTRDYMAYPIDLMGNYAGMDVRGNRLLADYLIKHRPEGVDSIWNTEILLTSVLHDMEMDGMLVDPQQCRKDQFVCLNKMITIASELADLTDREFTNSSQCIGDILLNQFKMPILVTKKEKDPDNGREIDTGRPTFDKTALPLYRTHPIAQKDPTIARVVDLILAYRKEAQHEALFLKSFLTLHDENNRVHSSYNQVIRTGRMSCKRPNSQQQNEQSKRLIYPDPGYSIVSNDYSQIEFRLIIHYIQDEDAIRAYNEDPKTDFHQWVADLIGCQRQPAKRINFGMGYGAGKRKVTKEIAADPDIIEHIGGQVNEMVERGRIPAAMRNTVFLKRCEEHASSVYHDYHEKLPGIKSMSELAAKIARNRGYVRNLWGRRRALPTKFSRKAFNTVIQGGAMDLMKERMVALSPRYNAEARAFGLRMMANIHDEVLTQVPTPVARSLEFQNWICDLLERPSVGLRIPIITGLGISDKSWCEAAGYDGVRKEDGVIVGGVIR